MNLFAGSPDDNNPCLSKVNCAECITSDNRCSWCLKDDYFSKLGHSRCDFAFNHENHNCSSYEIYHPIVFVAYTSDRELSNVTKFNLQDEETVQLKPQRVHLKLKPNVPQVLNVQFRQALDYPVDLYYLMDLSNSMADDKETVAQLGNSLSFEMQSITSNFRLGFGSFVDKVLMPYVNQFPNK